MLNPAAARQMISMQGERVRWFQALPCDCRDPGDPDYGDERACENCERGYVYREQDLADGVKALVTRQRREYLHPEVGMIRVQDLTVTTMADELPVDEFDKLILVERAVSKKEIVQRGAGTSDVLGEAYPVEVVTVADGDTVFVAGEDFVFDETTGAVVWLVGGDAPDGQTYAVHYTHAPVYWYTGAMMTEARPMPGHGAKWPQTGILQSKFPEE